MTVVSNFGAKISVSVYSYLYTSLIWDCFGLFVFFAPASGTLTVVQYMYSSLLLLFTFLARRLLN